MKTVRPLIAVALLLALGVSVAPAAETASPALIVSGSVSNRLELSLADFKTLPRVTVRGRDHGGPELAYTGVAIEELLKRAGAPLGDRLRGTNINLGLLVKAADGYRAAFALAEFDSGFTDRTIILADEQEGAPLDAARGPLRVVVPGEKRQARWVRQVIELVVLPLAEPTSGPGK